MSHKIFVEKRNIYLIEILSNFLYVNNKIIEGAVDITSVGIQISVTQNICEKKKEYLFDWKGLGAIRAKIGPTSDVDKIFSKMYSHYVLFINKYT